MNCLSVLINNYGDIAILHLSVHCLSNAASKESTVNVDFLQIIKPVVHSCKHRLSCRQLKLDDSRLDAAGRCRSPSDARHSSVWHPSVWPPSVRPSSSDTAFPSDASAQPGEVLPSLNPKPKR